MSIMTGCTDSSSDDPASGGGGGNEPPKPNPDAVISDWQFDGSRASMVAAAQVAGKYAVADAAVGDVEIRNIQQKIKGNLNMGDIQNLVPDSLSGNNGICAMTLTPSGRFLYMAICSGGTGNNKDAIVAYNTNTKKISVFDRLTISEKDSGRYGMTYYQGKLYVGSDKGIYIYGADKNAVYEAAETGITPEFSLIETSDPVSGLAVDMVDQKVYVSTPNRLYRMNPDGSAIQTITSGIKFKNLLGLSMGRVYGSEETGGLFLLHSNGSTNDVLSIPLNELRSGQSVTPVLYSSFGDDLTDIAATADGQMLLADRHAKMMGDKRDTRLSYEDWLHDELSQYLAAIKSLVDGGGIAGTNNLVKPGFLVRKIDKAGESSEPNDKPIADNVGWALFLLMAIDQVMPDPDIERIVELLIKRHAGLHSDGYGGVRTVDGHFVRNYESTGLPEEDDPNRNNPGPQPQVYVSMKFLPAAFKAAELYPHNPELQTYKEYLRQLVKRSSDTVKAEQRITWTNDDFGPVPTAGKGTNGMSNETWIFGDIAAAQDPLATTDYATYTYDRSDFAYDHWVKGEPVIRSSHSAFIVMGATMILNHHFDGDGWDEQNRNYYGITMAETDDMGAPYFAAFSAGNQPSCPKPNPDELPCGGYDNDGPSQHPNNILHFPAVLGFGQHGVTAPVVGGYMAYRDGRRQAMQDASGEGKDISMLTRWSMTVDDFVMNSVGIADFWYGGIGLAEAIKQETIDKFRDDFYRPDISIERINGRDHLLYSNMTPRRVIGVDGNGNKTPYGFQMSPFQLLSGGGYADYEVIDPEGDWIELEDLVNKMDGKPMRFTNPYFERQLDGWTKQGSGSATIVTGTGGKAVQISGSSEISVSQPLDVALALDNTRYIVRALSSSIDHSGKGYLRLNWRTGNSINSETIRSDSSDPVEGKNVEVKVKSEKPEGGKYLHIEYVAEGGTYQFENTAVMIRGADSPIENGDFENCDETGWDLHNQARVEKSDYATVGECVLRMNRGANATSSTTAVRHFDIADDPIGTRYLFRFDANASNVDNMKFGVDVDVLDEFGERSVRRRDVADILPGFVGERTFTLRKRPDDKTLVVTFDMKRTREGNDGAVKVYIDNLRLDKERLFKESDCHPDSPTGCLPTRRQ